VFENHPGRNPEWEEGEHTRNAAAAIPTPIVRTDAILNCCN
jgi:hypothetical protein